MRVLVGCEFSGVVRRAFAVRGHDAWSCDLLPAEDGSPNHIQGDVLSVLGDGWDLAVFHPPCTHLAVSGAKHFHRKRKQQEDALAFFCALMYDIESDNDRGQIERYIEVKSLSGDWEGPHAGMTDTQFKKNEALGDRYWLYVVERADQPDFRIWRIHNPAQRVTFFMFDDGWKSVAEEDVEHAGMRMEEVEGKA